MPGESDIKAAFDAAAPFAPQEADDLALAKEPRNDVGNSRRLIARHGRDLAAIGDEKLVWVVWDDYRWSRDGGAPEALTRAQATSEAMLREAKALLGDFDDKMPEGMDAKAWKERQTAHAERVTAHRKFAISSGNMPKCNAMLAAAAPRLRVPADEWDTHPFLLNTLSGTLNLEKTDEGGLFEVLRPERRHRITRLAQVRYEPEATCPNWLKFLERILPDKGLQVFVQCWYGYTLTGDTSEQKLVIQHGAGANGKSTMTEVLASILGDYAVALDVKTFMHDERRRGSDATPDLIRLPGARLVTASEPEQGDRISESLVKTITGSERVTARPLFKDQIEFDPQFKLMLSTNEKPVIRGQDEGIWRRVLLLPFSVTIPREERTAPRVLKASLLAEASGIFNWMLDGYRLWREEGLQIPTLIEEATSQYRAESDPIGEFLKAATARDASSSVQSSRLYSVYAAWCKANAIDPRSHTAFGKRMSTLGFVKEVIGVTYYRGLRITQSDFGEGNTADGSEPHDTI